MPLPENAPLNTVTVFAHTADVSTPGSAFTLAPARGRIVKLGSVIHAAVTTADTTVTGRINGAAITGGAWTIAQAGAAAGDLDSAVPAGANAVNEGDRIEFVSDGASSGVAPATFFATIRVG